MKRTITIIIMATLLSACNNTDTGTTAGEDPAASDVESIVKKLTAEYGEFEKFRIQRGVRQVASLWQESDGDAEAMEQFCLEQYRPEGEHLDKLFQKLERNFEIISGTFLRMEMDLMVPLHLDMGPIDEVDNLFGSYSPSAHLTQDFFNNKIAFLVCLNFPFYTLTEKNEFGAEWSNRQWAYSRLGDMYTSRVPAELYQQLSTVLTRADNYISEYNIHMGRLKDEDNRQLFPDDKVLITHWGLRDELKSAYADETGQERQEMIYQVMKRIIDQSIPKMVINNPGVVWKPYSNNFYMEGLLMEGQSEENQRYQVLLDNFNALRDIDAHTPYYDSWISRKFEGDMEIPQAEVESLFVSLVSAPQVKQVAALIAQRLGRELRPYDIWYDGFKSRGSIPETELDQVVAARYPSEQAFEQGLPLILRQLGFGSGRADEIASMVQVDASRGAGHAWGAEMRTEKSRLRTRIGEEGMNYKGYNIAVHEFGHNVEQTITLHDVDYYMLRGVPNTAFTEALAFMFQKRDLELLGLGDMADESGLDALDVFWSAYEIMGVSLVDMRVWKWLYENPEADAEQLKTAVITIAKEVWNEYYAPVFGMTDEPILAVYSHMIDNPLYLSAYPLGHLIEFQVGEYLQDKHFASEVERIWKQGRVTPGVWMQGAVGEHLSVDPLLRAVDHYLSIQQ